MEVKKVLKASIAGLSAMAAFVALNELLSSGSSSSPKPELAKRLPLGGPILIAPASGVITGEETQCVLDRLHDATGPVDLLLHAYGGYCAAVDPIVLALKNYRGGKIRAHVPYFAFSGATMIALGAHTIHMGDGAVLGPVDPQLGGCAAADLVPLAKVKRPETIDDLTHLLVMRAAKAYTETRTLVATLVSTQEALDRLTSGLTSHGHPITFGEASALQLPVWEGVPETYYKLLRGRRKKRELRLWL